MQSCSWRLRPASRDGAVCLTCTNEACSLSESRRTPMEPRLWLASPRLCPKKTCRTTSGILLVFPDGHRRVRHCSTSSTQFSLTNDRLLRQPGRFPEAPGVSRIPRFDTDLRCLKNRPKTGSLTTANYSGLRE